MSKRQYDVGEKPGKGRYCCVDCDWSVYLDDDSDRLPPLWQLRQGSEHEVCQVLMPELGRGAASVRFGMKRPSLK